MKKELELKDIACYLPYDLTMTNHYCESNGDVIEEHTIIGNVVGFIGNHIDFNNVSNCGMQNVRTWQPLLIPMSAITQPMTVEGYNDGEEFVPLIELAKIYLQDARRRGYYCDEDFKVVGDSVIIRENYLKFNYDVSRRYFNCESFFDASDDYAVLYQSDLFQFMNMCHLDYNDLIGQGLAIDKTTYKL